MLRAAGGEHRKISFGETFARVLIDAVERIDQAIAESIGVDIEGRMDEMADIGPVRLVARSELDRWPEALALYAHPQPRNVFRGQFSLLAFGVQLAFERVERDLAHHGVQHVLDFGG